MNISNIFVYVVFSKNCLTINEIKFVGSLYISKIKLSTAHFSNFEK
jgi:hypothetical protein